MPIKPVCTYTADIYCGLREGYTGGTHTVREAEELCGAYCDSVGLGVSVTPTRFVYRYGSEPGVIVGLINYPRFPSDPVRIRGHARALAQRLKDAFRQERVTIVFPDDTETLGEP